MLYGKFPYIRLIPFSESNKLLIHLDTFDNWYHLLKRGASLTSQMRSRSASPLVRPRLYVLYVNNPDRFLTREESLYLETVFQ